MKRFIAGIIILAALTGCSEVSKAEYEEMLRPCGTTTTSTSTTTAQTTTTQVTTTETETTTTTMDVTTLMIETAMPMTEIITSEEVTEIYEPETKISSMWVSNEYEGTYYVGRMMGYTSQPCGASGEPLVSGYSVASNYFPFGTIIHVDSDYISGDFIVQDTGGMADNVIDFYFWDISDVPYAIAQAGRFPITVTIIN